MAVAWDTAAVTGVGGYSNASGFTFTSGSAASGSYGAIGIGHGTGTPSQYMPASGLTWGATTMTVVARAAGGNLQITQGSGNRVMCEGWESNSIPSGASTITGTFTEGGHYGTSQAMSFTGQHASTPSVGGVTGTTASGTSSTITAAESATDDRIVDVSCWDQTATLWVAGTGQDAHSTASSGGLGISGAMSEEAGNATVPASTWSWSGNALSAQVVWNIKAAASGITGPLLGGHLINGGVLLGRLVR